jgi:response regulator NasT
MSPVDTRHEPASPALRRLTSVTSGEQERAALLLADGQTAPADLDETLAAAGINLAGRIANELPDVTQPHTVLWYLTRRHNDGATIAAAAARRGWPVVVLAADDDPQHLRSAVATGATGYVAAPFTQERLLPALELAAARTTDLAGLRADVTEIQNRLDTRKVVERAKGLLMAQQHLTEQEAFRLIQRTAMDRRTSMRDVAAAINDSLAGAA